MLRLVKKKYITEHVHGIITNYFTSLSNSVDDEDKELYAFYTKCNDPSTVAVTEDAFKQANHSSSDILDVLKNLQVGQDAGAALMEVDALVRTLHGPCQLTLAVV